MTRPHTRAAVVPPAVAVGMVAVAATVPPLTGWTVQDGSLAPLAASSWHPRLAPATAFVVLLGGAAVAYAPSLARRLRWPALLAATYSAGVAWLVGLALVDGWDGLRVPVERRDEYLHTAHRVHDVAALLSGFIDRIPATAPDHWPVHVAGHPPGALLLFVGLVRAGLGGGLAAAWVIVLVAATTPLAVLATLRRLGDEPAARRVAPLLVFAPAAVWAAVSADAVFAAVAAWATYATARAVTGRVAGWGLVAGLLLGACAFLSYGLPLIGVLSLGVCWHARTWRPLPWLALGGALVVAAFAAAGFVWWEAYPVLRDRYYAGAAGRDRPAAYWVWGDLAALCLSAGFAIASSVVAAVRSARERSVAAVLTLSALACVLLADASLMSKAEVQRIWLPFVPWLLAGLALVPGRQRRWLLAGQIVLAVAIQSLIDTRW